MELIDQLFLEKRNLTLFFDFLKIKEKPEIKFIRDRNIKQKIICDISSKYLMYFNLSLLKAYSSENLEFVLLSETSCFIKKLELARIVVISNSINDQIFEIAGNVMTYSYLKNKYVDYFLKYYFEDIYLRREMLIPTSLQSKTINCFVGTLVSIIFQAKYDNKIIFLPEIGSYSTGLTPVDLNYPNKIFNTLTIPNEHLNFLIDAFDNLKKISSRDDITMLEFELNSFASFLNRTMKKAETTIEVYN